MDSLNIELLKSVEWKILRLCGVELWILR